MAADSLDPAPRNRLAEALPILRIEIEHAGGVEVTDPNGAAVMGANRREFEALAAEPSDISGRPAVIYRADDVELRLAPDELLRLLQHALRPQEFFSLVMRYGIAHEWHGDFYDLETGEAIQPMFEDEYAVLPRTPKPGSLPH